MLTCQKEHFSIPGHITYLNCAYMSPLPKQVEAAGIEGLRQKSSPWSVGVDDFFAPVEALKKSFAKLINAENPQRIAVIPSVSYAVANAVQNINPKPGQNIVMLEEQFPSNVYSWQKLADKTGCELRIIKAPGTLNNRGEKWNAELLQNIDGATAAIALPHTHWADGTLFDLLEVRKKADETGAYLIIDGTQSVGAMPFDVAAVRPDALICAGYKWLLGAYGFGLAYYSGKFKNGVPIEENWINRLHSEDFQKLVDYQPLYKPGAHRFCVGENSQFIAVPMLSAALKLINDWGTENIQTYCRYISKKAIGAMRGMDIWIENEKYRGHHLLGARLPNNIDIEKLKTKAKAKNIFLSFRGNAVRIAPHLYNSENDFDKLVILLKEIGA